MKINSGSRPLGVVQTGQPRARKTEPASPHDDPGDLVQFSGLAAQFPGTDLSKMDQLQSAIDAGAYRVSPDEIAKSIIADAMKR